ncbi:MAG: hypothetical protein ACXWXK_09985 [Actinomycetota bacterium]
MTDEEEHPTGELLAQEARVEEAEREEAERAASEEEARAHERRAEKAAYLKSKLEERAESERD